MDQLHVRKLLLGEYNAYLQIVISKGLDFDPPYTDGELAKLPLPDLKLLVARLQVLSRTPSGNS